MVTRRRRRGQGTAETEREKIDRERKRRRRSSINPRNPSGVISINKLDVTSGLAYPRLMDR